MKKIYFRQKTGSRNSDGNVPNSNWNSDDKFNVNNYGLQNANPNLSLRQKFLAYIPGNVRGFCVSEYLSQPFIILEISCNFNSMFK